MKILKSFIFTVLTLGGLSLCGIGLLWLLDNFPDKSEWLLPAILFLFTWAVYYFCWEGK